MKKALNSLKKAVPPKARIAILAAFFGMGVVGYLIISIFSSSGGNTEVEDSGMVRLDTVIQSDTELNRNPLLSDDNAVNRTVADLNRQERERLRGSDSDLSHFEGIDLNNRRNTGQQTNNDNEQRRDVVDLSSMFAETDDERKARENRRTRQIESLEEKLDIPKSTASTIMFDRASYLQDIDNRVRNENSNTMNERWSRSNQISQVRVRSFESSESNSQGGSLNNAGQRGATQDSTAGISRNALNERRNEYLARYDDLKTDLERRMNGNTQNIQDIQNDSSNSNMFTAETSETGQDYPSNKTYGAGEIIYAINDIEIVSNEANVVRATVAQNGDTYGAIMLGEFTQIGDVLGVRFNSYTVNGRSYPINAIAIDANTWKSGLADNVDHHYFSRYFGLITSVLAKGYAETLVNTSQTNTPSGVTEGRERIESVSERLQYAVGQAGEYLAPQLLEGLNRPSTVTVNRDKGVGVMFMADFRVPARR